MTDITQNEPHGTMIRSNFTGMVLVKLRYVWTNLNNSVCFDTAELDLSEWTLVHRPDANYGKPQEPEYEYGWAGDAQATAFYASEAGASEYMRNPKQFRRIMGGSQVSTTPVQEAIRLLKASGDYALDTDYGDAIRALVDYAEATQEETLLRKAYLEGKSDAAWERANNTFAPNPYPGEDVK